ncbi:MAG: hypothetical protein EPN33_01665 [Acidobacteria bacterium]|nr:MAG: hypothetical protein EPN33_01665 [Acidobacteriota bacterium]
MSVKIKIPVEAYDHVRKIAEARQISVEDVVNAALADQAQAWDRLRERAARGDREKYLAVLAKVPDQKIEPDDDLRRQLVGALSASGRTLPAIEARTPSDQRERPGQKVASH